MPGTPLRALLLTLLAAAPAGGALVARSPHDSTGVIQACVRKDGRLRLVARASDCRKAERPISWNEGGPHAEEHRASLCRFFNAESAEKKRGRKVAFLCVLCVFAVKFLR